VEHAVQNLRKRDDYTNSMSVLSRLIRRCAIIRSRTADTGLGGAQADVEENPELDHAMQNLWTVLSSFGDRDQWRRLEDSFRAMMKHPKRDAEFDTLVADIGHSIENLLTNPDFFESADQTMDQLKQKSTHIGCGSTLRDDVDTFLQQLKQTLQSVSQDKSVSLLVAVTKKIARHLSNAYHDKHLSADALHIFLPLMIRSVQYIPIPRLEISVPEMDLLLESVILEPSHTPHYSSFLPYQALVTMRNDVELRKTHSKAAKTSVKTMVTVSINGLNVSAKEFGYWLRVHSAPFLPFLADEGIASFALDQRGIDISMDLEIGRDRVEEVLSLRGVRVHIHKLNYTIHKGKWIFMWWLLRPFLKHMIRRILEKTLAEKIVVAAHSVNRELIFVRERLRATRISDPRDLGTFLKAVLTGVSLKNDQNVYTRLGLDAPGKGIFEGVYTPGSIVKVWHEEMKRAQELAESGDRSDDVPMTWRSDVFDVTPHQRNTFP
jgi:hypothetical protein